MGPCPILDASLEAITHRAPSQLLTGLRTLPRIAEVHTAMATTASCPSLMPPEMLVDLTRKSRLGASWGGWLQEFDWAHYFTLTFRFSKSPEVAKRAFDVFVRRLEQRAYNRVEWFRVIERSPSGMVHIHGLLGQTRHLPINRVQESWKCGITSIQRYDPRRGATWYITKAIWSEAVEADVSDHLTMVANKPGYQPVARFESGGRAINGRRIDPHPG